MSRTLQSRPGARLSLSRGLHRSLQPSPGRRLRLLQEALQNGLLMVSAGDRSRQRRWAGLLGGSQGPVRLPFQVGQKGIISHRAPFRHSFYLAQAAIRPGQMHACLKLWRRRQG